MRKILYAAIAATTLAACNSSRPAADAATGATTPAASTDRPVMREPAARVFRISDPAYASHVTATLAPDGTTIASYPAVNEVDSLSAPLLLVDGYYLDNIGADTTSTVFLDWTYAQYASLPATPTANEVKTHVVPGVRVTEVRPVSMAVGYAKAHPDRLIDLLRE